MKVVRTAAHARQAAPTFGALTDHEILKLRQLPAWVRWLYFELVAMSDFKTGLLYTSYAQLASLLDPDQPVTGGKRLEAPTHKQIRTALEWLGQLGLALRDKRGNEQAGALQIQVPARFGFSAPSVGKGRGKGRGSSPQKADEQRPKPESGSELGQGLGQVYQESNSLLPLPLHVDKLSTGDGRKKAMELSERLRRERTSKKGPPGGRNVAPAGPAPQVPALAKVGDVIAGVVDQVGPPGGQESAPAGHAPEAWHFPGASPGSPADAINRRMGTATGSGLDGAKSNLAGQSQARETKPSKATRRGGPKSGDG